MPANRCACATKTPPASTPGNTGGRPPAWTGPPCRAWEPSKGPPPPFSPYPPAGGPTHEVWLEDAGSPSARLALIAEYGFLGAGIWNLMRPFPQLWQLLASLYDIRESVPFG